MDSGEVTTQSTQVFQAGTLWNQIVDRTQHALRSGALWSIPTEHEVVEQNGVRFLVRTLTNLIRKEVAKQHQNDVEAKSGKEFNPFLPYEADLFVANISPTHVAILNKFNVVDHHLLIITRAFESQETWLTATDFAAMWRCLAEYDGLVFYNAGKKAGASQRHKHLQIIPLSSQVPSIPMADLFASAHFNGPIATLPDLPFIHAFTTFDPDWQASPLAAAATLERYYSLLNSVGISTNGTEPQQTGAYNLLATRTWMLMVPRSQEAFASIPVNSLGFAGTLLVRNDQQMQLLKEYGPMTILSKVAMPSLLSVGDRSNP